MVISIKGTNLDLTPALKRYAEQKILSLAKFFPGLTHARVELERTTKHHHKGDVWRAEANLHGPKHLFRAEAVSTDIYAAVDAVKDELKRELHGLKEKRSISVRQARLVSPRRRQREVQS
ncbi:ribosomal subunit interface protein [Candidatus Uhrbacteria bacterium RIFCSPLOWO2_12_FULL_46_10]|uniref:Ribosomal subunit interface protein n=1 Tax=Candidatus Uhrbacteria bacterium RIFCSPLOWO2_01_FULL_47_25 TaxID=1802402 RepID=A0A1F7UR89_9BACT|nr:MAG: Sigma-54 modulation protein [Parcubacteria group bacterium GW2011_GWA2_46_9]OGL59213.1 MAG: ribosomal subunit interface protein [Candidatus Uhrbacteria bacterium RIFCSPHIGHO2_01_FULL_46_23]OGL69155.1 MAG: ribosomal subunit interface protein [Candidatus Uhrbacteria bacterium RIFCSPHIGHO2_02_FULL_47_29]OGL75564.1 MAG: ribosomal subunit interface protein [Candidatus Uhrbacteria bacterium RIFCSPHIGHO2_12_FULL_46_13]OGL80218.1 MAG: ribosomal subunit interface protein [Candidatus Uhrbacteria 